MADGMSYKRAGVDIDTADAAKREMAAKLASADVRVLNSLGAFASLFEARFPGYREPVLVVKTEEPGSKQLLAMRHGRVRSLCSDLVNHLVNDIAVMGARPLFVQDCIVCGRLEPEVVGALVAGMAEACREVGCSLTGGETSEQPGTLAAGTYVLTACGVGIVEKSKIVDGAAIVAGDTVLALPSNGLHTNGYSLVRALLAEKPELAGADVEGEPFLDVILRPHTCYLRALEPLFGSPGLHGMAHITGGGIRDNLRRVLPDGVDAAVDVGRLRIPAVFRTIRDAGAVADADMLRTFNMGAGLVLVVAPDFAPAAAAALAEQGCRGYAIGTIVAGGGDVRLQGAPDS
jgi:phosphoribosylformylglycinamidine cyclo-ligase